ncbi:hypothetical protein [Acidianus infernus]|uniref:hypothetical protein n=1 Tax=Acidianus infernus TaxID=12915 RepID=UPI00359480DD
MKKKLKIDVESEFSELLDAIRIHDCYSTPIEINEVEIKELNEKVKDLFVKLNVT